MEEKEETERNEGTNYHRSFGRLTYYFLVIINARLSGTRCTVISYFRVIYAASGSGTVNRAIIYVEITIYGD